MVRFGLSRLAIAWFWGLEGACRPVILIVSVVWVSHVKGAGADRDGESRVGGRRIKGARSAPEDSSIYIYIDTCIHICASFQADYPLLKASITP